MNKFMPSFSCLPAAALAACLLAGVSGCGGKADPRPEDLTQQPRAEAVTPGSDDSAGAALAAARAAAEPEAESAALSAFPGEADLQPSLNAVNDFCARPGSLGFMTRDGCRAALVRLAHGVSGQLYFVSLEDCQNFLQKRLSRREEIMAEHRAWCQSSFVNLHDRRGCLDAAPVFLGSFTEEGFCRNAPPAPAPQRAQGFEAPYLEGYGEPGQKFDQPRRGPLPKTAPAAKAAAPAQKAARPAAAKAPDKAPAPAPASAPVTGETGPVAPSPAQAPATQPAPTSMPASEPTSGGVPAWPEARDLSAPAQLTSEPAPSAESTTGPNAPAAVPAAVPAATPESVPAAVGATSGGQPGPASVLPSASGVQDQDLPEPFIGNREDLIALPPVPAIGRIAPPLMPGVPPDTAVSENTLPAPADSPPALTPPTPPDTLEGFGSVIPNFVPPAQPRESGLEALPLSGAPAGQAAP